MNDNESTQENAVAEIIEQLMEQVCRLNRDQRLRLGRMLKTIGEIMASAALEPPPEPPKE